MNIIYTRNSFEQAFKKGVKIIAKIPLDSGWLSGKYHRDSTFTGVRARWSREDIMTRAELVEQLKKLPVQGQSLSQFALQYCLAYEAVSTVIPGVADMKQLLFSFGRKFYLRTFKSNKRVRPSHNKVLSITRPRNGPLNHQN
ncbi:MAG: aldo/keto reductase [Herbinix sp.]|nr:aldo/keto reductase [Herbinix sp.]